MKKTTRIMLATTLALAVLGGLTWVLAWRQPTISKADASAEDTVAAPAAPLGLPTPYLNHPKVVDAPYSLLNIWPPPALDGYIAPGEYAHADKVTFPGYGGYYNEVEAFFKQDGSNLYIAFDLPALIVSDTNYVDVYLDTDNDGGVLDANDYLLRAGYDDRFGVGLTVTKEYTGSDPYWHQVMTPTGWAANVFTNIVGGNWQVEFSIQLNKIGVSPGSQLGLALATNIGTPSHIHFWPSDAYATGPDKWGTLVSSSDWGTFYWKPGPWEDYAPSGMPDFDQMQLGPQYCGPYAAANSLWWFDSKFETLTGTMPPIISDTYRLVTSYNPTDWDDHDPQNVVPFASDLANYFGTTPMMGTNVISMFHGTQRYLRDRGLWDDYIATLVVSPTFRWIADEVMRSEDVILLLGFYEDLGDLEQGPWNRIGGHYVTVAGIDPNPQYRQIAFSDPGQDLAELTGSGRVLSGTIITHYPPHPSLDPTIHDDAGNVSHDVYFVAPGSVSPGGEWWLPGYEVPLVFLDPVFLGINPNPFWEGQPVPYEGHTIHVEIEFALAVSPFTWKSSGYWEEDFIDPLYGTWQPWVDYAPNGVPDFDQRQDNWGQAVPGWKWTYCGPVAAANSLWWFDSKFEPSPVGPPPPPPYGTIPPNDNYPLVAAYGPWDDHDPQNVETGAPVGASVPTPWTPSPPSGPPPPGGEFVDELAMYFDTDGILSGIVHQGTIITDVYRGIEQYLWDRHDLATGVPLRQGYVITQVKSPDFWWVAEEVEHSEDVILLMGFWTETGPDEWVRLGGHYVTVPGIDKQGGFVAFSDPWFDRIEQTWPLAGIGSVPGWPSYMGRVADGRLIPHPPYAAHAPVVHNDAGNVSHDVYNVVGTDSPGGMWGPEEYVTLWAGEIEQFLGQNQENDPGFPPLVPVQTEVDWAIAVSPVADVWTGKTFKPDTVSPGDTVTITLLFGNYGSLPAEDVVLADTLPSELINPSVVGYWTSSGLPVAHQTGTTFTWDLPDLAWMEWGMITLTVQVDPSLTWPAQKTITNEVKIATSSLEQYQVIPGVVQPTSNVETATLTIQTADVEISKSVAPSSLSPGDWLTYTLTYTNHGQATATGVVITDALPSGLINIVYTSVGAVIAETGSFSYTWNVSDLAQGMGGVITITAQVNPSFSGGGTLPNTAHIGTDTPESNTGNNASSANATVIYYALDLQPDSATQVDNPDNTVTHTLTIYNQGSVADTFNIAGSVSGETWTTNWPSSVGPVAASGSAQIDVTVQIPSGASSGDTSQVSITATSQGDGSKSDTSVLTTTAHIGTITHGVEVAPPTATGNGDPGGVVTYTLLITNTGTVADTVGLSHTGPTTWTVSYSLNPLSLGAGVGTAVDVYVGIPVTAPGGSVSVFTITATSQGDPTEKDDSRLTTTVSWRFVYLPLVLRNY